MKQYVRERLIHTGAGIMTGSLIVGTFLFANGAELGLRPTARLIKQNVDSTVNLATSNLPAIRSDRALNSIRDIVPIDAMGSQLSRAEKIVIADLATMEVKMYQEGRLVETAEIRSIGTPGSFWETPTGRYTITYTNPNHISSIGNVNMPFSMQYSGNFFVHGWPTYLNGVDVEEGFSGGCIRMDTPGAERVFNFAPSGTELLVIDSSTVEKPGGLDRFTLGNDVSATQVLVAETSTGRVLAERGRLDTFELGKLRHFIQAFVANESIAYSASIPLYSQGADGTKLLNGNRAVLKDVYPELLGKTSLNHEHALINFRSPGFFQEEVENKVYAMGMDNTVVELVGDRQKVTATSEDVFHLSRYLYYQKPFLIDISPLIYEVDDKNLFYADTSIPSGNAQGFAFLDINGTIYTVFLNDSIDFDSDVEIIKAELEKDIANTINRRTRL